MSKTLFVTYRDAGFWAYDVASGIFLKHLIDAAEILAEREDSGWLRYCVETWRFNAVVSDCGLYLGEGWTGDQVAVVRGLIEQACTTLARRTFVAAEEMEAWNLLDGEGVFPRGDPQFPTAPVIELGHAIVALLDGTLPPAPDGTWWYYGTKAGRKTIEQKY